MSSGTRSVFESRKCVTVVVSVCADAGVAPSHSPAASIALTIIKPVLLRIVFGTDLSLTVVDFNFGRNGMHGIHVH